MFASIPLIYSHSVKWLFTLALAFVLISVLPALAGKTTKNKRGPAAKVYLIKGMANIFSQGMVALGDKLDSKNIENIVFNHSRWRSFANKIIKTPRTKRPSPIIVIGHSFGANAALLVAKELSKHKIPVRYVVTFDPGAPSPVPANVRQITNFWVDGLGPGKAVRRGRGFRGKIENVDVSKMGRIGHFNIDKNAELQARVLKDILRIVK